MKEALCTQILLEFLLEHYVVFIDKNSLKSEQGTWEDFLTLGIQLHEQTNN